MTSQLATPFVSSTFPGLTLISWRNIKPVGGRDPGLGNLGGILGERYTRSAAISGFWGDRSAAISGFWDDRSAAISGFWGDRSE